jgi:hypothetical protein
MTSILSKLESARKELLDLGMRNKLINHKTLRLSGLDIVEEQPIQVFKSLVSNGSKMTFAHDPAAMSTGLGHVEIAFDQPEADDIDEKGITARHTDLKLQTTYSPALLQRRLLNTFYAARTAIEEQGANTLYLALGVLKWYESESSNVERVAPLVLVPVRLERASAQSKFSLLYSDEDIGPNLSLREKLKAEFSIELPMFDEIDEESLPGYFADVKKTVEKSKPRWSVDSNAITLGFFAFAKFLMFKDLDKEGWEKGSEPHNNETIKSLLETGFSGDGMLSEDVFLDDEVDPSDVRFVVDADSSQAHALLEIRSGRHQVIQGPPGTGKSQTITNIVADALSRGQKVLFVAEKMAALEVVKRRLSTVGVGEACIELHSNKTNKKEFLEDLRTTLYLNKPVASDPAALLEELKRSRNELNQYCDSVNKPVGNTGISPVVAYGRLLKLGQILSEIDDRPSTRIAGSEKWSGRRFRELRGLCREVQAQLQESGTPARHPFWGTDLRLYTLTKGSAITEACNQVLDKLDQYEQCLTEATHGLDLAGLQDSASRIVAHKAVNLTADSPIKEKIVLDGNIWKQRDRIIEAIDEGREHAELLQNLSQEFVTGTWEKEVGHHRGAIINYGPKWWRIFVRDFREAKNFIRGHARTPGKYSIEELLGFCNSILRFQELANNKASRTELLESISKRPISDLPESWADWKKDIEWAYSMFDEVTDIDLQARIVTKAIGAELSGRTRLRKRLNDAKKGLSEALNLLNQAAELKQEHALDLQKLNLEIFRARVKLMASEPEKAQELVVLNHQFDKLDKLGAKVVVESACHWRHAASFLVAQVEYDWYTSITERAFSERSELAVFSSAKHEEVVRLFREKDVELFDHNKRILALQHYQGLPRSSNTGGQMALLRREFEKKRRHLPIRKLMLSCGNAIQAIKPVFMMSPLSIATYLPPGSAEFDLVIFDEASQVKPVDAFGALVRAKQAVVVGDSRQLPPTSFFDLNLELDDEEAEETDLAAGDMESILSLFTAQGAPEKMLRWHYRSRHDSLIAISNMEFYDNRLFIFPSPFSDVDHLGLKYHYLPKTHYERGTKKSFNRGEAKAVAKAVMEHAASHPDLSLGVAAFSMKQMVAILDELELLRRNNPLNEGFFSHHPNEPFFVKNLENVQGDERDVIFISIGYGKDENGYVAMNFGPLNRDGGERRLNVLITRARSRCEIFTNLLAEDIDLNRSNAAGVRSLRRYLKYAKDGIVDVPEGTGQEADSDFEISVADKIVSAGYDVDLQVGSAGFRIDIGVIDPHQPGRYILGVECDGATYHSARWARDRDRIRQSVLEGLGWTIHRVWSTDWFRSPQKELQKILKSIEASKAVSAISAAGSSEKKGFSLERAESEGDAQKVAVVAPYQTAQPKLELHGEELHEVSSLKLAKAINAVVSIEEPVHKEDVLKRIRESVGIARAGSRIQGAFELALRVAIKEHGVINKQGFLWKKKPAIVPPRDRSSLESFSIAMIAPEELKGAIMFSIEHSLGILEEDIPSSARGVIGFKRTTEQMEAILAEMLRSLRVSGVIEEKGGHIFLVST